MHLLNLGYTHAKMDPTIPKHKQIQRLPRKTIENHRKHRKTWTKPIDSARFQNVTGQSWAQLGLRARWKGAGAMWSKRCVEAAQWLDTWKTLFLQVYVPWFPFQVLNSTKMWYLVWQLPDWNIMTVETWNSFHSDPGWTGGLVIFKYISFIANERA